MVPIELGWVVWVWLGKVGLDVGAVVWFGLGSVGRYKVKIAVC